MAKEMVLSPVFIKILDEEIARKTFARLTEGVKALGGIVKDDFQKVGKDGYMITYAFPDNEKRMQWKNIFKIE